MSKQKCSIEQNEVMAVLAEYAEQHNKEHNSSKIVSINGETMKSLLSLYDAAKKDIAGLQEIEDWSNVFIQLSAGLTIMNLYKDANLEDEITDVRNGVFDLQILFKIVLAIENTVTAFEESTKRPSIL